MIKAHKRDKMKNTLGLDRFDRQILELMQKDAGLSNQEIAE